MRSGETSGRPSWIVLRTQRLGSDGSDHRSAIGTVGVERHDRICLRCERSLTAHPFAQGRRRYLGLARPSTTTTLGSLVSSSGSSKSLLERLPPPITTRA
jgi:hypothetical protein